MPGPVREALDVRFWRWTDDGHDDACWFWRGRVDGQGYGFMLGPRDANGRRRHIVAHRFAYELLIGPIPARHDLHHECHERDASCPGGRTCRHRRCVNPAHVTPQLHPDHQRGHGAALCRVCGSDDWRPSGLCADGITPKRRCGECNRQNQRRRRLLSGRVTA